MKKIKVSELPLCEDASGLYVMGVNSSNQSVKFKIDSLLNNNDDNIAELIDEITDTLSTKQDALRVSGDLALSADSELSLTDMAKKRLFIDLWNSACGSYGKYNEESGFFELNGLTDIPYWEACIIIRQGLWGAHSTNGEARYQNAYDIRTALPIGCYGSSFYNATNMFRNAAKLERVSIAGATTSGYLSSIQYMFFSCKKLTTILDTVDLRYTSSRSSVEDAFAGCAALVDVNIYGLKWDIHFKDSPLLSYDSLNYLLKNAANTAAITVTLHPDVYAKIVDESNAQWHSLLALAQSKNISLATA